MPDAKGRVVVEAHALRKATAMAALLHGSRRTPRDLKRPVSLLLVSAILAVLLVIAFWGVSRVGDLMQQQKRTRGLPAGPAVATASGSVDAGGVNNLSVS